ncbi:hypothetical protein B0A52_00604 [Exophiala mesophila]|uniref:Mtf2-like C-terminal domain-containing protein n=1 Tax=Exophiala mesophila TaxID=212818 RepID=A0A438NHP6_EXOME|nr:hypothetical protein B0A52_00604 [Exophiala mesophila]
MARKPPLPFLYQTRTILRSLNCSNAPHFFRQQFSTHQHLCSGNHSPSHQKSTGATNGRSGSWRPGKDSRPTKVTGDDLSDTPISPHSSLVTPSTITPAERRAFDAILSSTPNKKPSRPPVENKKASPPNSHDIEINRILDIFSNSVKAGLIGRQSSPAYEADTTPELTELPSHLIEALSLILDHTNPPEDLRDAVFQRLYHIISALDQAWNSGERRGDIALWEACEQHVFSLASSLSPPSKAASIDSQPELASSIHQDSLNTSPLDQNDILPESETQPPVNKEESGQFSQDGLDIFGQVREVSDDVPVLRHVYPTALLYVLHIFTDKFPSSHLVFNLLPRIRQLGHTSYVLGATTHFYNHLIEFQWQAHSSLRQIHHLLVEMDRSGVEHDLETCQLLRNIQMDRTWDLSNGQNLSAPTAHARGADWWNKYEQIAWYPQIVSWQEYVSKSLNLDETSPEPPKPYYHRPHRATSNAKD